MSDADPESSTLGRVELSNRGLLGANQVDPAPLVVGLTGANASGKGVVSAWFRDQGFTIHSLSDIVRDQAAAEGLPPERVHLIRIGTELRRAGGPGALAQAILDRVGRRDVVDSIRNPAEVAALRRLEGFRLVGVRATVDTRFQRSLERARPGDPRDLAHFLQRESQENSSDPASQQLDATFRLADVVLENDGSLAELQGRLAALLDGWERAGGSRSGPC